MNPGNIYKYTRQNSSFLVLLLSSDKEPGFEWDEEFWRCAEFQIYGREGLLGAQIVLYTKPEIEQMQKIGELSFILR